MAEAILYAAEHPVRDIVIGGGGRLLSACGTLFPRLTDLGMRWTMPYLQRTRQPARPREEHNLFRPNEDGREGSGMEDRHVFERSAYTRARLHPAATGTALAAAIGAAALLVLRRRGYSRS